MQTNLIKNAIRNTKTIIAMQKQNKPKETPLKTGLLSRSNNDTMQKKNTENNAVYFAKKIQDYFQT
tara:strand:- start:1137 stop:1334 length:198 start_codon:yes stop_codon:yes gene_type:complete